MNKNYTSIEQSKKLLELGLDSESADMIYMMGVSDIPYCKHRNDPEGINNIPCWSVGALMDVMPESITYSDFKPFPLGLFKGDKEKHSKYGHYWIQYFNPEHGGAHVQTNGYTPIEAAYNMIVWLLENNYIKKEK